MHFLIIRGCVNFINILRANFLYKNAPCSFSLITFWLCNLRKCKALSYKKCWWNLPQEYFLLSFKDFSLFPFPRVCHLVFLNLLGFKSGLKTILEVILLVNKLLMFCLSYRYWLFFILKRSCTFGFRFILNTCNFWSPGADVIKKFTPLRNSLFRSPDS